MSQKPWLIKVLRNPYRAQLFAAIQTCPQLLHKIIAELLARAKRARGRSPIAK